MLIITIYTSKNTTKDGQILQWRSLISTPYQRDYGETAPASFPSFGESGGLSEPRSPSSSDRAPSLGAHRHTPRTWLSISSPWVSGTRRHNATRTMVPTRIAMEIRRRQHRSATVRRRGVPISATMLRTSDVASRFHAWAHPARRNGLWALSMSFLRAGVERTHSSWGPGSAPPAMRRCERHTRRWQFPEKAAVGIGAA